MDFEVRRTDLHEYRTVESSENPLSEGDARLRVLRFGFSANNITYAVFGDLMRYWSFFPAEMGWGRIPVWGFAEVESSNGTGLIDGELVYGYFPMSSHLVVRPVRVTDGGFVDASPHRSDLPSTYNGYTRACGDPVYDADTEAAQMLFRPLFMTDFVLDDWLDEHDWFGAEVAVLSSASSKTAFGLAHLMAKRENRGRIIGLTSPGNVEFVEGLGSYDLVLTYDQLDQLPPNATGVYVDMAGDAAVRHAVHTRMSALRASVQVGGTHWNDIGGSDQLPGPTPALFFAPDQIVKRGKDWGPGGVESRFADAWNAFLPVVADWVDVIERHGPDGVVQTYEEVLDGRADPRHAFVLIV